MVRRLSNGMRGCGADDDCRTAADQQPVPTEYGDLRMCHHHANAHAAWLLDELATEREKMMAWALVRRYGLTPDPLRSVRDQ